MGLKPWEVLSSKEVFKGVRYRVVEEEVRMPAGNLLTYPRVEKIPAVTVVPVLGEELVMVRQYRFPVHEVSLELPAGHMEEGESPIECAARELEEETGYRAGRVELLGSYNPTNELSDQVFHVVLAEELEHGERGEFEASFIEVELHPIKGVVDMVKRGIIKDGRTIVGLALAGLMD